MKNNYQRHIDEFNKLVLQEVVDAFDHIDEVLIPPAPAHLDQMDASLNEFVQKTVPNNVEALIGEISRKLKTEYEYFSIEQSKEAKVRGSPLCLVPFAPSLNTCLSSLHLLPHSFPLHCFTSLQSTSLHFT